jgi:hypothetical protein
VKILAKGKNTLNESRRFKGCKDNFISMIVVLSLTKGERSLRDNSISWDYAK